MVAQTRRGLTAGLAALIASAPAVGAAGVTNLAPPQLDADILSLRAELSAAVAGISYDEAAPDWSDEEITRSAERLSNACWAIADAPRAQTPAGLALKCAAAMHQLRFSYSSGWPGDGENMAWDLLSELAGDVYVPPILPAQIRANCEPERA